MHNPTHPGVLFRRQHLEPLGISITEAAKRFGMSRKALSQFLNGRTRLSLPMAKRLAQAMPGSDIGFWLRLQLQYDLAHAERIKIPRIKPFRAA
jgi:addiction module HigA family antidote